MITPDGLRKLQEDLLGLKTKDMRDALKSLSDSRDKSDVSENGEYEAARDNLNMVSIKIRTLEEKIRDCVVVQKGEVDIDSVQLFTTVTLLNTKTSKDMILSIVTDDEIDVKSGKISQNSPIAQGLIGKTKGSKVMIDVPVGTLELEIMDISC